MNDIRTADLETMVKIVAALVPTGVTFKVWQHGHSGVWHIELTGGY